MAKTKKASTAKVTNHEAPKKETQTAEKKALYHLEIKVNDTVFKTEANSIKEALVNFIKSPAFPHGSKTKFIIKYGKGKAEHIRLFHTNEARRMLMTLAIKDSALEILAEQLNRGINE